MRDFRDAKAMARTIRADLAANGLKITVSQSLELVAKAFGAANWNTLAAAIRADANAPKQKAAAAEKPTADRRSASGNLGFADELHPTLHRAVASAKERGHEHATLEHLLLALVDDKDASALMRACRVDLHAIKKQLSDYLDSEPPAATTVDPKPTAGFQRVIQRAVIHVQASGRQLVNGAMFSEQESRAAHLLSEHALNREDAVAFMKGRDAAA